MAGSYNKVLLMGNLTRDVELRHLPNSDQAVAKIGLAINHRYRTKDGENREEVTFVDCEAWGRTAETMAKYLQKGRPVFIEGRLKLDQWQDKQDGSNRSKMKVVIESFQFIDSRGGEGGGGGGGGGGAQGSSNYASASTPQGGGGGGNYEPVSEDDIPF